MATMTDGQETVRPRDKLPKVELVLCGEDGNGAAIIGRFRRNARRAGWTTEEVNWFTRTATSGSYEDLLALVMDLSDEPEGW